MNPIPSHTSLIRATWLVPSTIPNPYLEQLDQRDPPVSPFIQTGGGGSTGAMAPSLWSPSGFDRPLTEHEQAVFTAFLAPFFTTRLSLAHPLCRPAFLAGLLCSNPSMQQAFVTAAHFLANHPATTPPTTTNYGVLYQSCLGSPGLWLLVWPWLPDDVRAAIRQRARTNWSLPTNIAMTLLDPEAPSVLHPTTPLSADWNTLSSRALALLAHPQTPDTIVTYLIETARTTRRIFGLGPLELVLLASLGPDALDHYFQEQPDDLSEALHCPQASQSLITRALTAPDRAYRDDARHHTTYPYLARINLYDQIMASEVPHPIRFLSSWMRTPTIQSPRLTRTPTPALRAYLRTALNGPYADLVYALWNDVMDEPKPTIPIRHIHRRHGGPDFEKILDDPTTSEQELALCFHVRVRNRAARYARHPNLTAELVHRMTTDGDASMRAAAAEHPLVQPEAVQMIANSPTRSEQGAMLASHRLEEEVIRRTIVDPSSTIRAGLARNQTLPAWARQTLAQDRSYKVRGQLLQCTQLEEELLVLLHTDPAPSVRAGVARHPHTPTAILQALGHDAHPDVRLALAQNLKTPAEVVTHLAKRPHAMLIPWLIKHPALSNVDRIRLALREP